MFEGGGQERDLEEQRWVKNADLLAMRWPKIADLCKWVAGFLGIGKLDERTNERRRTVSGISRQPQSFFSAGYIYTPHWAPEMARK